MRSCCSSVGSPRLAGSMRAQLRPARGENTARRDESQARAEHFSIISAHGSMSSRLFLPAWCKLSTPPGVPVTQQEFLIHTHGAGAVVEAVG